MLQPRAEQQGHTRPPPLPAHHPTNKNTYVGLTLKEYFNIVDSKHRLDEIDEENNSEISAGTPCFGGDEEKGQKQRPYRKNRNKTELQDIIAEHQPQHSQKIAQKMTTLSLEEFGNNPKKNVVKLPSIHEQRQRSNSRQSLLKQSKDLKHFQKRETVKARVQQNAGLNLALFLKKQQLTKGNHAKNIINARRGIRSRVTSTSFYHMNLRDKERERVKTEEQIEPALEKSFIITRYGGMMRAQNREQLAGLKNYQQSFKLTKK